MRSAIVAFSGGIGSGKSELSKKLADRLRWPRASFSQYVRTVAAERGLPPTREALQAVGEQLEKASPTSFCKALLDTVHWHRGKPAIVDGVRHLSILQALRDSAAPDPCLLVHITTSAEVRARRVAERDGLTCVDISALDSHSTERQVHTTLLDIADIRLAPLEPADLAIERLVCAY